MTGKVKDATTKSQPADRRDFLRMMSVGVVTGGAALTQSGVVQAATTETPVAHDGYRETDHVRRYYELAR